MDILWQVLKSPLSWDIISTLALIATLIYIIRYTEATKTMARANIAMADATNSTAETHSEEVRLQKRPVISIICHNEDDINFPTRIQNFSFMHAKIRVEVRIVINGKDLILDPDSHYAGSRIWKLQAGGQSGLVFVGHLDIVNTLKRRNISLPAPSELEASVTIDSWVINLYDDESGLNNDGNKNPTLHWYWDKIAQKWIPEPSPK